MFNYISFHNYRDYYMKSQKVSSIFASKEESPLILVLIICHKSTNIQVYCKLKKQWQRYMNLDKRVKVFFMIRDNDITSDYIIFKNHIVIKGEESYTPGIYEKTIFSMKILLNLPEFSRIKYVIRTNISAFWIWDRLLKFVEDKPTENYCASGLIMDKFDILSPHGSNMIFSKDVALKFSNEYDLNEKNIYPDDIVLGYLCKKYNIKIQKYDWCVTSHIINNYEYVDFIKQIPDNIFTIRNNILDPKLRDIYEGLKYKILTDHYYFSNLFD